MCLWSCLDSWVGIFFGIGKYDGFGFGIVLECKFSYWFMSRRKVLIVGFVCWYGSLKICMVLGMFMY